jgi:molybdate transport system ATP-binding protein
MEDAVIHIEITKVLHSSEGTMALEVGTDIQAGTLTALYGPSGAGKTTLLRMLAGLTAPDAGTIRCGNDVWYDSERGINISPQERSVGLMFQEYALFPNMTVEQNIRFAEHRSEREFTGALLEALQLTPFAARKPAQLSGGQKQRVALARAIVRKPRLLLLDEPLSALDASMRAALQDEIAKAHSMLHSTTLMVSHDLHEVFRLANHVVCIDNGTVTVTGTPQQVFSNARIGGRFQVTGQIAAIVKQDIINIVTVITGNNTIVNVIASDDDIADLSAGDSVLVFSKAFNPIIQRV